MTPSRLSSVTSPGERVQFETLLSDISAQLIAAPSDRLDETIQSALDAMRRFFEVGRCALLSVSDDLETVRVAYAAYGPGASHVSGDINLALFFPWLKERLLVDRKPVAVSRLSDLPPEASLDRASCEAMPTHAFLNIPIQAGPTRLHLIVLNTVSDEREWPEEYLPRLRLLGEMLVNALERGRASDRARQEAARVAAAVAAAGLGFAEWMPDAETPYLDSRLREILSVGEEDLAKAKELWAARADAESRLAVDESRRRLLAGEIEIATIEYRYDHPRRGPIWLRQSSRRMEGEGGKGARIVEAVEDVTERREGLEEVHRLRERLERENTYLRQEANRRLGPERIVGRSAAIRRTLALADQVAVTDSTVLLLGETGSGKERLAAYIHENSRRRDRPMIRVNCSAIPASLIESELFGREKGAYTGALSKQLGRFELAQGSTLFLDEIGEIPIEIQVKLLRALENRTIERLGNPKPIPVDVRIIAATNRDLAGAVKSGRFRDDLYYRLNVFPLLVPPLRERREDIPLFIRAFVDELSGTMGKRIEEVDPENVESLAAYAWPGNVRELRNVVERAMIMATGPTLRIEVPRSDPEEVASSTDLTALERKHIQQVLHDTGWRVRGPHGAAARLGLRPTTLESRIKKLGLTRPGAP